ncbi:Alpha-2-macroglobulin MG1 domain protein [Aquisphaera giovannonii]|uniref:Alpha-2-macroglobulin MG1 domain protein n=1 Tax=Aquisphaera giovannonii TaxID=406548 RepID=A0A5B9W7J4_9BACT|nr:carboxypeptidase-like regulatory domain-containing protein [Aquisphaera giovannonii]QEH36055.1 Alpha-2-macroglobulin MG1 domain protein [Aquisphaera giovannonii]
MPPLSLTLLLAIAIDGPTISLAGRVVDSAGTPAAGAAVVLAGLPTSDGVPTVARGTTDADGRFSLERPAGLAGEGAWRAVRLWASRPGDRLASVAFPGALPGAGAAVRLALPPRGGTELLVEGPDGRPVAGARVRVGALAPHAAAVPKELASRLEATTGADGRATLDAVSGEQVGHVEVEAEGLGIQPRFFDPPLAGPKRIELLPAAALEGRFVAEGGRPPRGWTVSATTATNDGPMGSSRPAGRTVSVPLAEDGSFRFPAIAAGMLDLWVVWPEGPDPEALPAWPQGMRVQEGRVNRVEIPVRPAATITGVIRERGTGAPVPGVRIYLFRPGESSGANATTDAQGRFAYRSLPGRARAGIGDVPPTHVPAPAAFRDDFQVPPPPGRVELPPVELARAAPPLRGFVRDAAGAAVAGADVEATWTLLEQGAMASGAVHARSDAAGRFAAGGLAPGATVALTARKEEGLATRVPVAAREGQDQPVTLTLEPRQVVAIAGRVVAQDGTPLAGAAVRLQTRTRRPGDGSVQDWRPLSFQDGPWIYTGADGSFRTPGEPRAEGVEFQAEAAADGYLLFQGPWTAAGPADVARLPDLVLRRESGERAVAGRVIDAAGRPIAGAKVLQRGDGPRPTESTTDADGRFRLPGVAGGRALLAAEAPGFRTGGTIAGPEGPVEIRLARADEPVRPPGRAPEPLTRAAERELGRALFMPKFDEARALPEVAGLPSPDAILARLDPDRAVAMLEERVLRQPAESLIQVALARFEDDPAAAPATLDADRSGTARARGLIALADLAATIAPDRRAGLLDRAVAEARRLEDPEAKLVLMGEVADRLLESFELDRAAPILREGRQVLKDAKPGLFAYQVAPFGEAMAAIDLPAAEAFLARRAPGGSDDEGVRMRDRGAMAIRAAVSDPAAAGRLARELRHVPNFSESQAVLLRVARNMARRDLPGARAVLDLLDGAATPGATASGSLRPYGLALLADARAAIDPDGARGLLDEAFAGLRAAAEADLTRPTYPPVPSVMAGLLPLVERLQPDRVAERLWLALACRPTRIEPLEASRVSTTLDLAMLLSRYDRQVAAAVYEPAGARLPELAGQEYVGGLFNYGGSGDPLKVLAAYDPRALAALIERLPESARVTGDNGQGWATPSLEIQARLAGAQMLGLPPEARRQAALETPLTTWPAEGNGRPRRWWP